MKTFLLKVMPFVGLLLLLAGCADRQPHTWAEDRITFPKVDSIEIPDVFFADKLTVSDSFLVVINRQPEPFFYVYDKNSFELKGKFGVSGNGPYDFIFPFFVERTQPVSGRLSVYDVNLASFKEIDVARLLAHQDGAIAVSSMPPSLIGASVLAKDGSRYYGNMDGGEGLFFVYDSLAGNREWIPFPASLQAAEGDFTVMNASRISVRPDGNRIVAGMRFYNKLFLYDAGKREWMKETGIGQEAIAPIVKQQSIDGESRLCCMDVQSTDKHVYVLMQRIKEKDWDSMEKEPSRIVVLDWDLNYVKTYQLAHFTNTFTVDASTGRILYTAVDENEHTKLYYWETDDGME